MQLEKEIQIVLVDTINSYELKLDGSIANNIKAVILPLSWGYKSIKFISDKEWAEVNKIIIKGDYPVYGIIFGNQLKLYPTPGLGVNGDIITLLCSLTGTDETIDLTDEYNDPDVPDVFDDALEYYITAKNLFGNDKIEFMQLFQNEIRINKSAIHQGVGIVKPRAY